MATEHLFYHEARGRPDRLIHSTRSGGTFVQPDRTANRTGPALDSAGPVAILFYRGDIAPRLRPVRHFIMRPNKDTVCALDLPLAAPALTAGRDETIERERRLVEAAMAGDPAARREIYEACRERIWTAVVYWIGDPHQAQDVHQTVFLKAFRGLRGFRFRSSLFTWLYRIARNECRNHLRRRRAPLLPLEAILGSRDEVDPEPASGDGLRLTILRNALMQLPRRRREVVVLRFLDGLSYKEMSRALGCPVGTVASRLNRALADLEERLRPLRPLL